MQVGIGPNETGIPHHVAIIQAEVLDPPAPEFLWALSEVFHHLLAPSTHGVWSPPEQQAVALEFYERLFGHKVQQTWIRSYMLLVEEAKRRLLAHRANAAVRTKDTQAAAAADGQGLMTPEQLLAHAREITSICPESCRMPAYADDPELVAWLIARMGFDGGGGRSAMTRHRLKQLVLDPTELADAIEQFAARVIGRVSDSASALTAATGTSRARRNGAESGSPSSQPASVSVVLC